jgi:hypothetical protein
VKGKHFGAWSPWYALNQILRPDLKRLQTEGMGVLSELDIDSEVVLAMRAELRGDVGLVLYFLPHPPPSHRLGLAAPHSTPPACSRTLCAVRCSCVVCPVLYIHAPTCCNGELSASKG